MNSQRVKTLRFRVGSINQTTYEVAGAQEFETLYGRFLLEQDWLTVWPAQDYGDTELAVEQVMPFLKAWEIKADLDFGPGAMRFIIEAAELEPTSDSRGTGDSSGTVELRSGLVVSDKLNSHLTRQDYPSPPVPAEFGISEQLALAHHRWFNYKRKREPLPAMAYFIFTIFKQLGGGSKRDAAKLFEIDSTVLDALSRLSSVSGDAGSVRKYVTGRPLEMPDAERAWLDAVVKRLIRRLGECAAISPLERITMSDFPALP